MTRPKSYDHPIKIGDADWTERGSSRKRGATPRSLGSIRLVEIEKLLRHRGLEATPARHWIAVLHHALLEFPEPMSPDAIDAARQHLAALARNLRHRDREAIVGQAATSLRRWSARALGEVLGLTEDERRRLDIRTIRFAGQTRQDQRQEKRSRDRQGAEKRRRDQGAIAREVYLDTVTTTAELARLHGVSERTIRRWRAAGTMREAPDVRGSSRIASRREASPHDATRTPEPSDLSSGSSEGEAGPRAPARPPTFECPAAVREVVARVADVAASARQIADRVDQALAP
ncbi:MAG: hypothetical protein IOC54_04580, partial [Methylobacterium sp.]|nr:hypothetical protein [Methylobacterium sp.]MCA3651099.1 hypothetical protein [Methylobacterium sp.]MCA4921537.1 hypothetical protein [Methylobacterium sp.]